jgi:hypothetical protein
MQATDISISKYTDLRPTQFAIQWVLGPFRLAKSRWAVSLTPHLCLVLRLRMSGAIPLLPLYAFMAYTGKTLWFNFYYWNEFVTSWNNFLFNI